MRYWDGESRKPRKPGKGPRTRRRSRSVTSGGSVHEYPFLRSLYHHHPEIGGRVQRIAFFLALAGLIYAFVLGEGGFIRIAVLRSQRADLDREIAELTRNTGRLERESARLKNDPDYIEKVGRERYGLVKRGDRVYKILPENPHGH